MALNNNRTLMVKTFVFLMCREGVYTIYMLNKHYAFEIQNYGECPLMKLGHDSNSQLFDL